MASKIVSEDEEKSLYLVQIRYLEEQLESCQLKCDKLETRNKSLVSEYNALMRDKQDTIKYRTCSLSVKKKKVSKLSEELEHQQQTAKRDTEALKLQHRQQMEELQQLRVELDSKRSIQATKLEEQQEELKQMMQQQTDMESLQKQLLSHTEEVEAAIRNLKAVAALRREQMHSNLEKSMKEQEELIVPQRAKDQHSHRLKQLSYLQKEAEPLRKERDAQQARYKELRCESADLKKEILKMNTLKSTLNEELKLLKEEYQKLQAEILDSRVAQQQTQARTEDLRQRLHFASEKLRQKSSKLEQLEAELQMERSRRTELEGVKWEAAIILMDSEKVLDIQWKMQRLLEILESSAPSWKTGFSLSDCTQGQKPQTSKPVRKLGSLRTCSSVDPSDPSDPSDPTPPHADIAAGASTSADR